MVRNADWNWNDANDRDEVEHNMLVRRGAIDLLPWADPYIALLIASLERGQLQAEEE